MGECTAALTLTEATQDDAPLLRRLMLAAYAEYRGTLVPASGAFSESDEQIRHAIAVGGGVIAAINGVPVGCGRYEHTPDGAAIEVGRLSVLPEYRGRGIAAAMLAWFESRAAALGLAEVRLGVRLALPRNITLYQRAGYVTFDYEDRPGYGRIAAWMRKQV